jgi:hypothetical protein
MLSRKWLSLVAVLFPAAGGVAADPTPVKPTNTWMGSVEDEKLAKAKPENGVVTTAKEFEKLVQAWKVAEKVPDVNFDKEIVLVATTSGSVLKLNPALNEKGDLKNLGFASRDLQPGFRYVIVSVPRDGVKTVNGKELPK